MRAARRPDRPRPRHQHGPWYPEGALATAAICSSTWPKKPPMRGSISAEETEDVDLHHAPGSIRHGLDMKP